jgi:hypothetical protein
VLKGNEKVVKLDILCPGFGHSRGGVYYGAIHIKQLSYVSGYEISVFCKLTIASNSWTSFWPLKRASADIFQLLPIEKPL